MKTYFLNLNPKAGQMDAHPPELLNLIEKSNTLWTAWQSGMPKEEIRGLCYEVRLSFLLYFKSKTTNCGRQTNFEMDSQRKIQNELLLRFHRSFEEFEKSGVLPPDFFAHHKAWLLSELGSSVRPASHIRSA